MVRRVRQKLRRFLALSFLEKRTVLHAALLLLHVRRILARDGVTRFRQAFGQADDVVVLDPAQRRQARQLARLVLAARHLVPGHCTCLHLALIAQQLLASRQIAARVRIGVRKNEGDLRAHAWLQASGEVLLDVEDCDAYHVLPGLAAEAAETRR
jgi:hypothetical protein